MTTQTTKQNGDSPKSHAVQPNEVPARVAATVEHDPAKLTVDEEFWLEQYKTAFSVLGDANRALAQADESVRILAQHGIGPVAAGIKRAHAAAQARG